MKKHVNLLGLLILAIISLITLSSCGHQTNNKEQSIVGEQEPTANSVSDPILPETSETETPIVFTPAETYKKLFFEQPLPVWMEHSLQQRDFHYSVENTEWVWAEEETSGAREFRAQFDFSITVNGVTETIEGLTVDLIRYNQVNDYRTRVTQHSLWIDENYLLAVVENNLLIYELTQEGIHLARKIDYSRG